MKKLFFFFVLIAISFGTGNAQLPEFSLHVKLFVNDDSARTVIFGYDPSASDSMVYRKESWFSGEFAGGEQLYPPPYSSEDLDFRMTGIWINRPELEINGSVGGPIDIRKKPALDSFILKYEMDLQLVAGTTNAKIEWDPQTIPAIVNRITLASYHFPDSLRLDLKKTSSFTFPLIDSGTDLYSSMILTLYYNKVNIVNSGVNSASPSSSPELTFYPNPMDSRSKLQFLAEDDSRLTLSAYDITGRKVFDRTINAHSGENTVDLGKEDLSSHSGAYLIRLSGMQGAKPFEKSTTIIVR